LSRRERWTKTFSRNKVGTGYKNMKKLLIVLGGIFAAIIVIVAILAIIFIPYWIRLNKDAKNYLTNNLPIIAGHWNPQDLFDRATTQLIADAKPEEVDKLYATLRQLGSLKHFDTPELDHIGSQAFTKQGTYTYGNYTIHAYFQNGSTTISIQLLRVEAGWKINYFHIDSPTFFEHKT
jgi:hypothetical protein